MYRSSPARSQRRGRQQSFHSNLSSDSSPGSEDDATSLGELLYDLENTDTRQLRKTIKQLNSALVKTKQQCKAALHEAARTKVKLEEKTRQEVQFKQRLKRLAEYEKSGKARRVAENEAVKELEYVNANLSSQVEKLRASLRQAEQKNKQRISRFTESLQSLESETAQEREAVVNVAKGIHLTSIDLQRHLGSHGFHAVPSQVAKTLLDALVASSANLLVACGSTGQQEAGSRPRSVAGTQRIVDALITPKKGTLAPEVPSPLPEAAPCVRCISLRHSVESLEVECESLKASIRTQQEDFAARGADVREKYRTKIVTLQDQCHQLEQRVSEQNVTIESLHAHMKGVEEVTTDNATDSRLARRHASLVRAIASIKEEAQVYRERILSDLLSTSRFRRRTRTVSSNLTTFTQDDGDSSISGDWKSAVSTDSNSFRGSRGRVDSSGRHRSKSQTHVAPTRPRIASVSNRSSVLHLKNDLEKLDNEIAELQHAIFSK